MALENAKFESYRSYEKFRRATMRQKRYVHTPQVERFLEAVKETAKRRVCVLPAGERLWRAQLGCRDSGPDRKPVPHEPERMKPRPRRAQEGRANPKGIPCLYLARDRSTAIAETRPWKGAHVSVGKFTTCRDLKLVDCTKDERPCKRYGKEPRPEIREQAVWGSICHAFARPVNPCDCDDIADYVPTQTIAELLKTQGYDGIEYRSSLGEGRNIALFDLDAADLVIVYLFKVKNVVVTPQKTPRYYRV